MTGTFSLLLSRQRQ